MLALLAVVSSSLSYRTTWSRRNRGYRETSRSHLRISALQQQPTATMALKRKASSKSKAKQPNITEHALPLPEKPMELIGKQIDVLGGY